MVDDLEQPTRENRERLLLGAPTVEQALVGRLPLGPEAHGHQGGHVQGMSQRPRAALGQAALPGEAAALVGARLQPGRGHHLVHAAEAGDVAQLGATWTRWW